jgi:predicted exporter
VAGLAFSSTGFGFVSLVGLLMVFGTATDYGVFCANYYLNSQLTRRGIWTALLFSGVVTIVGFLPLLFTRHIVLRQLGEPLCLGTVGTLIGTFLVQPWWMRRSLKS